MSSQNESVSEMMGGKGRLMRSISVLVIILSVFVVIKTFKEFKSLDYVGRDVGAANVISVTGKGEAVAIPDIATFTFSVEQEALTVAKAQESVTKKTNEILAYLEKAGIAKKDTKTTNYSIYPRYEYKPYANSNSYYPQGEQVLKGYVVNTGITVKVRKTSDAGTILSGVGGLGVTNISGLNFTVDKEEEVLSEARGKAIDDAKDKAEILAKELGVRLVRITSFYESGSSPIYYAKERMAMTSDGAGGAMAPSPEIPVGENTITSNVTITYEIR